MHIDLSALDRLHECTSWHLKSFLCSTYCVWCITSKHFHHLWATDWPSLNFQQSLHLSLCNLVSCDDFFWKTLCTPRCSLTQCHSGYKVCEYEWSILWHVVKTNWKRMLVRLFFMKVVDHKSVIAHTWCWHWWHHYWAALANQQVPPSTTVNRLEHKNMLAHIHWQLVLDASSRILGADDRRVD